MILYMFQCHSPKSSHPLPLPQSPKDCSIHLYLFCCLAYRVIDNILLTASSETILARKRELDEEGIRTINAKIDYLAGKKGYRKVLNESTPQVAVNDILTFVFSEQHKKNLKRLR